MSKNISRTLIVMVLLLGLICDASGGNRDRALCISDLRRVIAEQGLRYTVAENRFSLMSRDELMGMFGARLPEDPGQLPLWEPPVGGRYLEALDWRDMSGDSYVSGIRDQGSCGSCWDFAAVAMLESALMIGTDSPNTDPDYSEQYVLSCIGDAGYPCSCGGGFLTSALEFLSLIGTTTEICFPYLADDDIPCEAACDSAPYELQRVGDIRAVTLYYVDIDAIKDALAFGPVATYHRIHEGFWLYDGGVYSAHGIPDTGGGHFVLIVGFDDAEQCWIVKNSWGPDWGEDGFFRIAYDSGCEFGQLTHACSYRSPSPEFSHLTPVGTTPLGDAGPGRGVTMVDYDLDGDLDLYVSSDGAPNLLLSNAGDGEFASTAEGPLADPGAGRASAWADFDNDGDLDLFLTNWSTTNRLIRNDGDNSWTDVTQYPLLEPNLSTDASWIDFNRDGLLDLYLVNAGTPNRLYMSFGDVGGGHWLFGETVGIVSDAGIGTSSAWADYDNDGDFDVYLANSGGMNRLLRNDWPAGFTPDPGLGPLANSDDTHGVAWGDYDNDGLLDLYVANDGRADILARNLGSSFAEVTGDGLGNIGHCCNVVWWDYDNDGHLDLYVSRTGELDIVLHNDGQGGFMEYRVANSGVGAGSVGLACGDIDGDGDSDIYIANSYEANVLLRNDIVNGNNWIQVRLIGVTSNVTAIGSRIRVVAGGMSQIRELASQGSYLSHHPATAAFGLGQAAVIDSLLVRWPSGDVMIRTTLPVNVVLHLHESDPMRAYLNDFSCEPVDARVVLTWTVTGDAAGARFTVWREAEAEEGFTQLAGEVSSPDHLTWTFTDENVAPDKGYRYRVRCHTSDGEFVLCESGRIEISGRRFALRQNAPNPFNPATVIGFSLAHPGHAELAVFSLQGKRVATLCSQDLPAGYHEVDWDGRDDLGRAVASGSYVYRLMAGSDTEMRRLVLVR